MFYVISSANRVKYGEFGSYSDVVEFAEAFFDEPYTIEEYESEEDYQKAV